MRGHEGHNGAAQGLGPGGHEGDRLSRYRGCEGCHGHSASCRSSQASWVPGCTLVSGQQGGTAEGWQGAALDVLRMDQGQNACGLRPGCVDWGWDA